jgi:hypothetical protein
MYSIQNPYSKTDGSGGGSPTETLLRNLISLCCSGGPNIASPPLASVQAAHEQLVLKRDVKWTLDLAQKLGTMASQQIWEVLDAVKRKEQPSNVDIGNAALQLLYAAMEDWQDHILYAVIVQECPRAGGPRLQGNGNKGRDNNPQSLVDILTELALETRHLFPLHSSAMNVLALAWRSLDWTEQWLSLSPSDDQSVIGNPSDVPWWIKDEDVGRLSELLLIYLYGCLDEREHLGVPHPPSTEQERSKLSALILISSLLRRRYLDLPSILRIFPQSQIFEIISKLIKGIQVLSHSVLPPSSSEYIVPIALMSMSTVTLLQQSSVTSTDMFQSLNQTIQSTRLAENVVEFSMANLASLDKTSTAGSASRWIAPASKRFPKGVLLSFAVTVMSCWKRCDHPAWKIAVRSLQTKHRPVLSLFWSDLMQGQNRIRDRLDDYLPVILNFLQLNRQDSRKCISEVIQKSDAGNATHASHSTKETMQDGAKNTQKLLQSLFNVFGEFSGASYCSKLQVARILYVLLSDRRCISSDDELSRCLWLGVDVSLVERHWEIVLEYASTDDKDQPLLSALLDLMSVLLEYEAFRNHLLNKLNAHNIEAMIYLVKPRDVRFDFMEADNHTMMQSNGNIDSETPPFNNLSRMDETSICIEHEEIKQPRGWDMTVRLAAATALANFICGKVAIATDESTALVLSRISSALGDFLVEYQKSDCETHWRCMSLDVTRRLFRLQVSMCTPENEFFLADELHASRTWQKKEYIGAESNRRAAVKELQLASTRERELQDQKGALLQQLNAQSMMFQHSLCRVKAAMAQETKQVVAVHTFERSNAEHRAENAAKKLDLATAEIDEVKEQCLQLKNAITQAKIDLASASSRNEELDESVMVLRRQLDEENEKSREFSKKLQIANKQMESFEKNNRNMQEAVCEREDVISRVKDSNHRLHDNLEDLFADMCSLSQIFQENEEMMKTQKHKSRQEADEAIAKMETERTRSVELGSKVKSLEVENDKLYRKLAKYKERLEQERKERRDEHEQRKEAENRKRRTGPVSYLNSLHEPSVLDKSCTRQTSSSRNYDSSQRTSHQKSVHDKENGSSSYYTNASQRRGFY